MAKTQHDPIRVVEAAYRLDGNDEAWLADVLAACGPAFADGRGGCAAIFDREPPQNGKVLSAFANAGMDEELIAILRAAFEQGSAEERDRSLRHGGPMMRFSAIAQTDLASHPVFGHYAKSVGFDDLLALRAANPDGSGVFFAAPIRNARKKTTRFSPAHWSQLAAHIAAGLRLRRRASRLEAPEAILTSGGKLVSASDGAASARESLRAAVKRIEHARSRAGRREGETSIDAWTALVEGRWSLVDHFESDGKRFLFALQNQADAPDPRALSRDERPILHLVAMGHSNKLVAYELGLPIGTVATRLASIMRKLGVRSRVQIVDRYTSLRSAKFLPVTADADEWQAAALDAEAPHDNPLTAAEDEVAQLASRGVSNARIAKTRGSSPRTVANLLASAYKKLGISSRSELSLARRVR
ncbi:MAG: helix-turn-helix transcriptional regulator [Polyangiaceae bacterium]